MNLIHLHGLIKNPNHFIVDIGASYGVPTDPVFPFISNPIYKGLCIEGSTEKTQTLLHNTRFHICNEFIYPHNIIEVFQRYNVPIDLDVLKIDIDGFDLEVLRMILSIYKPKMIIAEINEKIPPPILFEIKYKENYAWDESHCFGFSIKSGEQLMTKYEYKILEIFELNNILCINRELCDTLGEDPVNNVSELYRKQYIENINRYSHLPWNENVNYWLDIKDSKLLKMQIEHYFCKINDRSKFAIKTKVVDEDFTIGIGM